MPVRITLLVLVLAAAAGAGCDRLRARWSRDGLSFDRYVDTMVQLRLAADSAADQAAFQVRKRALQSKLRVSDNDLRRFVREHSAEPKVMTAAWDSIEARFTRAENPVKQRPPSANAKAGGAKSKRSFY